MCEDSRVSKGQGMKSRDPDLWTKDCGLIQGKKEGSLGKGRGPAAWTPVLTGTGHWGPSDQDLVVGSGGGDEPTGLRRRRL